MDTPILCKKCKKDKVIKKKYKYCLECFKKWNKDKYVYRKISFIKD